MVLQTLALKDDLDRLAQLLVSFLSDELPIIVLTTG